MIMMTLKITTDDKTIKLSVFFDKEINSVFELDDRLIPKQSCCSWPMIIINE